MDVADKDRTRPSIHDVTILDDGKIVTQRVVCSCYMDTGSKPSGNTVGDGVLYSSLLDCHCNISLHVPTNEGMSGAVDFVESLLDCPDDVSTPEEPSSQQITKPAGVTPLLATQNISTPKVMIASADADFCDSLFDIQHDISNSKGSMTEQVTGTAEGAHVLKFGESSLPVHPDFGVHAPPTASRPTLEPFSSDVQILRWFPSL
ncbi:hypothetical protein ACH5RR_013483 [Cinchona calisaya]|uniref:Uncharacterized protein n=1 Tax=Cinchona calisaya TaxID=153742 RepID=A0ABD3A061_9GENT